jgi:hypothetical protein
VQTIVFQKSEYPIREVKIPNFGNVIVSTINLSDKLLNKGYCYVSEKAQLIDEQIFYYVDLEQMKLSDKEIAKIILSEII